MVDWGHRMAEAFVIIYEAHNKVVPLIVKQVEMEQNQITGILSRKSIWLPLTYV